LPDVHLLEFTCHALKTSKQRTDQHKPKYADFF